MTTTLLQYILPKLLNTSLVTSSLIISFSASKYDQLFIYFGLLMGFVMDTVLFTTATMDVITIKKIQMSLTSLITLLTILIGFDILLIKKKKEEKNAVVATRRILLFLLPAIILVNQAMETLVYPAKQNKNAIMQQSQPINIMLMLIASAAIGFAYYYINIIYFHQQLQTFCNSFIIYFTGAIALSKLFHSVHQPTPTSLVVLIRNQIVAQQPSTYYDEITGGYNLYWLFISCYLLYDIKSKH